MERWMMESIARIIDAAKQLKVAECKPEAFKPRGLWPAFEVRDLGIAAATNGEIGAFHMRALRPFDAQQGYHWHRLKFHMVYILRGSVTYRWQGSSNDIVVHEGGCVVQPPGAHNVIHYTDDVEVLEITMPAAYDTIEVDDVE
jgi:uncharacterized cupin superfamily protein